MRRTGLAAIEPDAKPKQADTAVTDAPDALLRPLDDLRAQALLSEQEHRDQWTAMISQI